LPITETELKLIASAAISGDSNKPVNGYNNPAAGRRRGRYRERRRPGSAETVDAIGHDRFQVRYVRYTGTLHEQRRISAD
jgi:hypothetical protein